MSADDTTLDLLREMVASQPDNWKARAHLIELLMARGETGEALALVDDIRPPDDLEARLLIAGVLRSVEPSRALAAYQAILDDDRRCAPAWMALAHIHRDLGDRDEARRHYGIAVVLDESLEDPAFERWLDGEAAPAADPAPSDDAPVPDTPEDAIDGDEPPDTGAAPSADELQAMIDLDGVATPRLEKLAFEDVGGMEELKERVRMHVIHPFRNPELFRKFKKRPGGGILLYGPPGCGKTYIARATAGECDAKFISVRVADILSRWLGESEQRLAEVFAAARRQSPAVIFIDEFDALGMNRRDARGSALTTTINHFLSEMDGLNASNENLMVLAATNAPWSVDPAFRRPGRFDRVLLVPPPDAAARAAILGVHLRDIPQETIDIERLVRATKGFSGADLKSIIERAAEEAIVAEMRSGKPALVTNRMMRAAAKQVRASTGEWLETARNYASYANRAGQYDDLADYLQARHD